MEANARIDAALRQAIDRAAAGMCPPRLAEALGYAVFPGGHRIRPRLGLAVAMAYGDPVPAVADAALCSIELLHCASLVHDDLPCFDDADVRRGKASVHVRFGEPLGLLCGDALILLAFQTLARAATDNPRRVGILTGIVSDSVGAPGGLVAGQAWECEATVPIGDYQRAKTGVLFAAATMAGAAAAGASHEDWAGLGLRMGEAYQMADDLLDRCGDPDVIGKPVGQDKLLGRPNRVEELGIDGATRQLRERIDMAVDSIPSCPGEVALRRLIRAEATRFMELALSGRAAA
jgi:geranylgeranyl diphosphate synthase type II